MADPKRYKNVYSRVGELLISKGLITGEQLNAALDYQKKEGIKLGKAIVELGLVDKDDFLGVLAEQLNVDLVTKDMFFNVSPDAVYKIPREVAQKYNVLPIRYDQRTDKLYVATEHPEDIILLENLKSIVSMNIVTMLADAEDISSSIERLYSEIQKVKEIQMETEGEISFGQEEEREPEMVVSEEDEAPAIRLVNYILIEAINKNATDIHIEPFEYMLKIRFRIDGKLLEIVTPPKKLQPAIISRIKIIANINIAEKRIPQDGRFSFKHKNYNVDIRVSTLPTSYGEKIVMRILNKSMGLLDVESLGISPRVLPQFIDNFKKPYGIILVSGPTGSGKTTTMYAILQELVTPDKNIITIEDPIEYNMDNVNQVQVNEKAGLTFAAGLRSMLRQDPDVIMVGEIRDRQTAEIAIRAALTGHMVLSTIHANDAPATVARLLDMGIPPYLVGSSLNMVVAQRLVRRICDSCKEAYVADSEALEKYGLKKDTVLHRGQGCLSCNNTGYSGRLGIFEILSVSKPLRKMIYRNADSDELRGEALSEGMFLMRDDGMEKVERGITTVDEVFAATFGED
ncbi:MAG TPA: type II secretion system protein GspE [Firmicutes bacterium]|nr:type II secretion system protein GspE [Bacillota bacterium]